jgi:hypothetical protein
MSERGKYKIPGLACRPTTSLGPARGLKVHKRATRVITGSNYEIRSPEIFEKLGWEKIEIILKKREHIMLFKALRGETPNYLSDLFVASHNNTYQLRSNDRKLYLNKPNTNFMKNSFSYRGAVSWNSLPAEIVDVYTINFPCILLKL